MDNTNKVIQNEGGEPASPFDYGNGEIQPGLAIDPGLVYDVNPLDYAVYLCNSGFDGEKLKTITGNPNITCSGSKQPLNYPSFSFPKLGKGAQSQRTVTNVGPPQSSYSSSVAATPGLSVSVNPDKLNFTAAGQKLSYTVSVSFKAKTNAPESDWAFAWLNWSDGKHNVRSTIAVKTN